MAVGWARLTASRLLRHVAASRRTPRRGAVGSGSGGGGRSRCGIPSHADHVLPRVAGGVTTVGFRGSRGGSAAAGVGAVAAATVGGVRHSAAGATHPPRPVNERCLEYRPGSSEVKVQFVMAKEKLKAALAEMRASAPHHVPLVINGEAVHTSPPHRALHAIPHDTNGPAVSSTAAATPALLVAAMDGARAAAAAGWASAPQAERSAVFLRAAHLLGTDAWRWRVAAAAVLAMGKTAFQAEIDAVAETADFWRFGAAAADDLATRSGGVGLPSEGGGLVQTPGGWNWCEARPLEGFVACMSPFNFISIGVNLPSAPSIVGNTTLWSPAPATALPAYLLLSLLTEAGLPPGVIQFVPGPAEQFVDAVTSSPDLAGVHFTGSTATFDRLVTAVGTRTSNYRAYPRLVGETGGKNFHLFHLSVGAGDDGPRGRRRRLREAVAATLRAAFEYSGQKCSACSRLYVPSSLWPEVRTLLLDGLEFVRVGSPEDLTNFTGAVVDGRSWERIMGVLRRATADPGVEVLAGGKGFADGGWFIEPTLLLATDHDAEVMREEVFGPVLTVSVYPDGVEKGDAASGVAAAANGEPPADPSAGGGADPPLLFPVASTPAMEAAWMAVCDRIDGSSGYALTGSIFATDRSALSTATHRLRQAAGNLYINAPSTGAVVGQQPFGGGRKSGTNDKSGTGLNLGRWVSVRCVREAWGGGVDVARPHMGDDEEEGA